MEKDINPTELDFLLRYPAVPGLLSPVDFLSNLSWGGIKVSLLAFTDSIRKTQFLLTKGGSVAEWLACWTQAQKGPG